MKCLLAASEFYRYSRSMRGVGTYWIIQGCCYRTRFLETRLSSKKKGAISSKGQRAGQALHKKGDRSYDDIRRGRDSGNSHRNPLRSSTRRPKHPPTPLKVEP